jgi:hypothetical protein
MHGYNLRASDCANLGSILNDMSAIVVFFLEFLKIGDVSRMDTPTQIQPQEALGEHYSTTSWCRSYLCIVILLWTHRKSVQKSAMVGLF